MLARGKAVYGVNCTACHGADLRGGDQGGPSLLRSLAALSDQHGEDIGPIVRGSRQDKGMPAFNLVDADITAVAEYIHSVLAKVGSQAVRLGPSTPRVSTYWSAKRRRARRTSRQMRRLPLDHRRLKGIGAMYDDPRTLQNTWVSGGGGGGRGGRGGGGGGKPNTVTVTLANGEKLEGTLVRKDDFIVTLMQKDGTRRSIARDGDTPKVEVHDPYEAHKKMVPTLTDNDMHDVTAYLATVK